MSGAATTTKTAGTGGKPSASTSTSASGASATTTATTTAPGEANTSAGFARAVLRSAVAVMVANADVRGVEGAGTGTGAESGKAAVDVVEGGAFEALVEACERRLVQVARACGAVAGHAGNDAVDVADVETALARVVPRGNLADVRNVVDVWNVTGLSGVVDFPVQDETGTATGAAVVALSGNGLGSGLGSESGTSGESGEKRPAGWHFPPLPPAHTYKRTKLDEMQGGERMAEAELRQAAQARRAFVRESLAKMRQDAATGVAAVAAAASSSSLSMSMSSSSAAAGHKSSAAEALAPLSVGEFDKAVSVAATAAAAPPPPAPVAQTSGAAAV